MNFVDVVAICCQFHRSSLSHKRLVWLLLVFMYLILSVRLNFYDWCPINYFTFPQCLELGRSESWWAYLVEAVWMLVMSVLSCSNINFLNYFNSNLTSGLIVVVWTRPLDWLLWFELDLWIDCCGLNSTSGLIVVVWTRPLDWLLWFSMF